MPVGLDQREPILRVMETQGTNGTLVAELLALLAEERRIAGEEYQPERAKREMDGARRATATRIARDILPALLVDVDTWEQAQLALVDATPKRPSQRSVRELLAIDQQLRASDDPDEIAAMIADLSQHADAYALRSAHSVALKRLKELAKTELAAHKIGGRAFLVLNQVLTTVGPQLRWELPDVRRGDIAEAARRKKQVIREQVTAACRVMGIDGLVARAQLELSAPTNSTTRNGTYWDAMEAAARRGK